MLYKLARAASSGERGGLEQEHGVERMVVTLKEGEFQGKKGMQGAPFEGEKSGG